MSTKSTIHYDEKSGIHLFEEVSLDDVSESPAYIQSSSFEISIKTFQNEPNTGLVTVEIPNHVMDILAVAWCKKRKLHGHPVENASTKMD